MTWRDSFFSFPASRKQVNNLLIKMIIAQSKCKCNGFPNSLPPSGSPFGGKKEIILLQVRGEQRPLPARFWRKRTALPVPEFPKE